MELILEEIKKWLQERPIWLKESAKRISKKGDLNEADYIELAELCIAGNKPDEEFEAGSTASLIQLQNQVEDNFLRIKSIEDVKGVSALGARNPLEFKAALSVVYGQNGSGKSSYTKLIKHLTGTRNPGKLMGNVHVKDSQPQECLVTFSTIEGEEKVKWSQENRVIDGLRNVQIYDTQTANIYVNNENEVSYEPYILHFFTRLTETCINVERIITGKMDRISLKDITIPAKFDNTQIYRWYQKLNHLTKKEEVQSNVYWSQQCEEKLSSNMRFLLKSDTEKVNQSYEMQKKHLSFIKDLLEELRLKLNPEILLKVIEAKTDFVNKKRAVQEDAVKVFKGLSLEGIGSDSWKLFWESARKYSEEYAYPEKAFPNVTEQANCVLCLQPLGVEAQDRLVSFESYVTGHLEEKSKSAENKYKAIIEGLIEVPQIESTQERIELAQINDKHEQDRILECISKYRSRVKLFKEAEEIIEIPDILDNDVINKINEKITFIDEELVRFKEAESGSKRKEIHEEILNLEARKYLYEYKTIILDNLEKLNRIKILEDARNLTKTNSLSTKKSSLADQLITTEYKKRFQKELKELGGNKIKVDLVKTRASKGQVYHKIVLEDCPPTIKTNDVLSEGEFRIVSLAGFLADLEVNTVNTPFIFDDPISSLDQDFEEATVNRLLKLSMTRQVIVFTHRISLLTLLEERAKKEGIDSEAIFLRAEPWGTGETGGIPLYAAKPITALNKLMNERLSKAKKVLESEGQEEYEIHAKSICSEFRILIERIIEYDLLGDIVHRFRRSVTTKGKLEKLPLITEEDCNLFEEMMTKYSVFEHSQSNELPVNMPEPEDLLSDMNKIRDWSISFKKRSQSKALI